VATGVAVKPRLVKSVNGVEVEVSPADSIGLDPGRLRAVQRGMFAVVNAKAGTGRGSRIADETMLMCGKSGTAQVRNISTAERASGVVSNDQLPWRRRDHALFVGYAPYDNPRYAAAVVVEHGGGGSAVAGPIVRDALLRALYGDIPPLTAYPADQRGRMESLLKDLHLRRPDGTMPESSKV
jgi:penicillin-binding protein 2